MTILFTGRKAHLTGPLKTFAEEKLAKLERVLDGVLDVHVILTLEKHRHLAEIVAKARTATLTAKAEAIEFQDSITECVSRLLAQAKKHRERLARERKRQGRRASPRRPGAAIPALADLALAPPRRDDRPPVVRMGRIPVKPMSVEEALLQVQDARHPVLVFRDAESQQVSVLFRLQDGQYGLLEAEA